MYFTVFWVVSSFQASKTKILYTFLVIPLHATFPAYLILLDLIILIISVVYKL
jgi:hypothetical protein